MNIDRFTTIKTCIYLTCKLHYTNNLGKFYTNEYVSINSQKFLQYVCLFGKYQLKGLRSRQNRSLLIVNEDFGGERNTANGTLWTDTNDTNHNSLIIKNFASLRFCA
jgi:hypothetical protein